MSAVTVLIRGKAPAGISRNQRCPKADYSGMTPSKAVHLKGKVSLYGRVPVRHEQGDDTETNTLPFCIESEITRRHQR
jgi:hypothetical protein